ncbi:hypothetical protein FRC07_010599 [Ceratobasidium sp. 392]|nr:hypothetical protein FRC07_010599 [Ceratobasidium sp. 392]
MLNKELTYASVVTQGFELVPSLQPRFQFNETLLEGWWNTRRLASLLRPEAPPCQPQDLGRGDRFRLSASLFDYTVMSTWNKTEGPKASGIREQKQAEYRGESFADCYVNNTRFDFSAVEQTQTLTVGVVCPGENPSYPIYVSMETSMIFAWQTSKDFIGQYYGPGLDLLNISDANTSDYRKLVLAVLEVIASDSLTIMRGQHLSSPAFSMSLFFWVDPDTAMLDEASSTFTYANGTMADWPLEANIYATTITNLVNVVNDAVNLDLGSNKYQNIFRNASALSGVVRPNQVPSGIRPDQWARTAKAQSLNYGRIPQPYQTWAEALLNGYPVKLANATGLPDESAMVTTYLCPSYQVKRLSSLLSSVFVGVASMIISAWGTWMLFTTYLAKHIMAPRVQCLCIDCLKRKEEEEKRIMHFSRTGLFAGFLATVGIAKSPSHPKDEEKNNPESAETEGIAELRKTGSTSRRPTGLSDNKHDSFMSSSSTGTK